MTRHLLRLANSNRNSPDDIRQLSTQIREILGSTEKASHFRIATNAFEFNLFTTNEKELDRYKRLLSQHGFEILGEKLLDTPPTEIAKPDAVKEAVELFNNERFWESHEVLEQIWRSAKGAERDTLQGVILTAAAFVHYQKGEPDICLSVLRRARARLTHEPRAELIDLQGLRANIDMILDSSHVQLFKIRTKS